MIRYLPNNIVFRIASAEAISKFKAMQTQAFIQLARTELSFNKAAKEVVLLEYDRMSMWLYRIERTCVAAQEGPIDESLVYAIIESFYEELHTIENIIEFNTSMFTKEIESFVKLIHGYSGKIVEDKMVSLINENIPRAYTSYVDIVNLYLQHVLTCMHEFNSNIIARTNNAFLSMTDFHSDSDQFKHLVIRADFFNSRRNTSEFVLKDYTCKRSSFGPAATYLSNYGVSVKEEPLLKQVVNTAPATASA